MKKSRTHSKKPPTPREGAYDLYWEFASKRHEIFLKRYSGQPAPWTDDPILNEFKFCNVYRVLDRVSQYMVREVCYSLEPRSPADALFQITAFRMFSRIETWESLKTALGRAPTLNDLADGSFEQALAEIKHSGAPMYTNAFIICATDAFGYGSKYLNHVALFSKMFLVDDLASKLLAASSLKDVFLLLKSYPLYGNFMAYQTAIDLNYSQYVNFSENDFTVPGPGALRGMEKLFTSLGDFTPAETVMWMVERQDEEFQRLGLAFNGLWGRKLQAIDAQGLFCETDKYCRVKLPELRSNRSKIKSRYAATGRSTEEIFLPPKWGLKIPIASQTSR